MVVIRTNGEGTSLTVDAALDTVHHYDYLDELTVTAVDPDNSYHEHGTVRAKATISSGHFVVEEGAVVPQVEVKDVQSDNTVKVTAKEETIISVDASSADKTTVVVESENVYATGLDQASISGSQASAVELPTVVTNEEELTTAIANNTAYIQLGASYK